MFINNHHYSSSFNRQHSNDFFNQYVNLKLITFELFEKYYTTMSPDVHRQLFEQYSIENLTKIAENLITKYCSCNQKYGCYTHTDKNRSLTVSLKHLIKKIGDIADQADRVSKRINIINLKRRV